jgi:hypothetical protein
MIPALFTRVCSGPSRSAANAATFPQAGQMLITYHAGPGSESEQRLRLLATLAT